MRPFLILLHTFALCGSPLPRSTSMHLPFAIGGGCIIVCKEMVWRRVVESGDWMWYIFVTGFAQVLHSPFHNIQLQLFHVPCCCVCPQRHTPACIWRHSRRCVCVRLDFLQPRFLFHLVRSHRPRKPFTRPTFAECARE